MNFIIVPRDWKEPFPIEDALTFLDEFGTLYVAEPNMGNDTINWLFSDTLIEDPEAVVYSYWEQNP